MAAPKGYDIRPTSDRVREAVFSMIGQDLEGFRVLDLFAGTGVLGIEAMSRGGRMAVFVDNSTHALELIRRNLFLCGLESSAHIVRSDLRLGLPGEPAMPGGLDFDLVFMDPPYGFSLTSRVLESLVPGGFLGPDAIVVVETSSGETLNIPGDALTGLDRREYGDTRIHIFARQGGRSSNGNN